MSIGNEIKTKRKVLNLTQTELAEKTGVCRNYISDLENDRYMPSVKTLARISKVLELDINFLVSMSEIQDNNKKEGENKNDNN